MGVLVGSPRYARLCSSVSHQRVILISKNVKACTSHDNCNGKAILLIIEQVWDCTITEILRILMYSLLS